VKRTWKTGDRIEVVLPKALHLQPLPDNPGRVALMWGPLVLAGDLGEARQTAEQAENQNLSGAVGVPVLVSADRDAARWIKPVPGQPGTFRTEGVGRDRDIELVPFYRLHRHTYAAYWDLFTPAQWDERRAVLRAEEEKRQRLDAATVGFAQLGQMQAERDVNLQGGTTSPVQFQGRYGRRATDWFSLELPVDPAHPLALLVTYNTDERQARTFEIQVNGTKIGEQAIPRRSPQEKEAFFDVNYAIPAALVEGAKKVTVRFQAKPGGEVATVYGVRVVRTDAAR
jgi:hypothetical protein